MTASRTPAHRDTDNAPEADEPSVDGSETSAADATPPDASDSADASPSRAPLRRLTLPSLAAVGGVVALERLRSGYQKRRMFLPEKLDDSAPTPASLGLPAEDQWFTTDDGVRLHGWWLPHPRPRATVLFCHGNTGNLGNYTSIFAYLRRLGIALFGFDYRGYGHSTGQPTETGLARDATAAWRHVTETLGIGRQRVVVFGHSLGGAVAIELADRQPVEALVVQSTFTDMRAMARHLHPSAHWMVKNAFRSVDKVGRLGMPKLFIHGDADRKIPIEIGRALFEAAAEPKEWYAVAGAEHNDVHRAGRRAYLRVLRRFLDQHVA